MGSFRVRLQSSQVERAALRWQALAGAKPPKLDEITDSTSMRPSALERAPRCLRFRRRSTVRRRNISHGDYLICKFSRFIGVAFQAAPHGVDCAY